jgi:hypothetical protein
MSSRSDVSSTALHLHRSGTSTKLPTAPTNGLILQEPTGENLLAVQFRPPQLAKEYFNARFAQL